MNTLRRHFSACPHYSPLKRKVQSFPPLTLVISGASLYIYYLWPRLTPLQSRNHFTFSEMNLIKNKAIHTIFLAPIAFEHPLFFLTNIPGITLAAYLIETRFGSLKLLTVYAINAIISALVTSAWHRHIGYKEVMRRGRTANHNGNAGLLLTIAFAMSCSNFYLRRGSSFFTSIPFAIIPIFYVLFYFFPNPENNKARARNTNETHYAAIVNALLLAMLLLR